MIVELESWELMQAWQVAAMRHCQSTRLQHEQSCRRIPRDTMIRSSVVGAAGEQAVAKATKLYPCAGVGKNRHQGSDLDGGVMVRTRTKLTYELNVKKDADPDHIYVLAYLLDERANRFDVVGWMYARDAMLDQYLNDPGGYGEAFFVPRSVLERNPIGTLVRELQEQRRI